MFDQDDQQVNSTQADYSQIFDNGFSTPAPGSPAGPVSPQDAPGHVPSAAPIIDEPTADPLDVNTDVGAAQPVPNQDPVADEELLHIKQTALHELAPLVGQLGQNPEEKFKTTMMMIQASDDQTLIKAAYDAAKQITDEKIRAQALLDVVNEINYFTQQNKSTN